MRDSAYPLLQQIGEPADLRRLPRNQLGAVAAQLRACVLDNVSRTGGHLSSNLGTVELTVALHYVFNTPHDRLVWDVGHQTYAHKILTGRRERMTTLRQFGGMSGFPQRAESPYDAFGTAHSSTSISAALGMALAARIKGESRHSVAIIGDGALTAGIAFEALNNAGVADCNLLVILNDNDMSISPPVGALNRYLAQLMTGQFYAAAKQVGKSVLKGAPPLFELAKRFEEHAKGMVVPATLFEKFGFNYNGPIDGHDLDSLIPTLENIRRLDGPQFLHVVTKKGQGYKLAEADPVSYHGPGKFDPAVRLQKTSASAKPNCTLAQMPRASAMARLKWRRSAALGTSTCSAANASGGAVACRRCSSALRSRSRRLEWRMCSMAAGCAVYARRRRPMVHTTLPRPHPAYMCGAQHAGHQQPP